MISGTFIGHTATNAGINYGGGTTINNGAYLTVMGKDADGYFNIVANDGTHTQNLVGYTSGTLGWSGTNFARTDNTKAFAICSGTNSNSGGNIILYANAFSDGNNSYRGAIGLYALTSVSTYKTMFLYPNGTWTWDGTACQITSDQRYKQQISKIDNNLLDAWEDVTPCQFKYNDAVNEKGNAARLHTGYVVQQIDTACKSHNVDISEYGLYCHEEYPERTEEVEVTQDDGTTTKETKVIREASEHYSLRYTETLVVECAYLRRENNRLKERLSKIENLLNI